MNTFWSDYKPGKSLLISAEKEAARVASGKQRHIAKPTPNSVRNVEPATQFRLKEFLPRIKADGANDAKNELGEIRRSQILQNGPGAIIDFRAGDQGGGAVSVLTSGLDQWEQTAKVRTPISTDTNVVFEPRLQKSFQKTTSGCLRLFSKMTRMKRGISHTFKVYVFQNG